MRKKLFLPGPVEVHPEILQACSIPMVYHRAKEYEEMHARAVRGIRKMLGVTGGYVFLVTSSSTGVMEAAIRNLVERRVLSTICGAFSERWLDIARENGKEADPLSVEWGRAIRAEMIEEKLRNGRYDAVTVVHNETSTGVMNPIAEIGDVLKRFPEVMYLVDAVSSMAGVPIEPERWGIDCVFAGVQKAFGLPPGLTVVYVSERAMEKAARVGNRGHYFDFLSYRKFAEKNQVPETPAISLIHALGVQIGREGFEQRYRRTHEMAIRCRQWAMQNFGLFPEPGYESVTLTAVLNTKSIHTVRLNEELGKRGVMISEGYGKIKEKTFRIAHMADITLPELNSVLSLIDEVVASGAAS